MEGFPAPTEGHTPLTSSLHSLSDGNLLSELDSLGEVDGTVFEINDFTTVTPWEVFISALDATLQEWSKMNVTQNTSITGTFLSTTISYNEVMFSLSFYMHGDHQSHTLIPLCSYPHEMMSEDPAGDFPMRAHPVTRWYGVKNFALLAPHDPRHQQTWTLSQTRFLFSSLLPAMDASHYQLPIFFRSQEGDRQMYVGVGHYDHRRTWFEMVHIRQVPPNLQYLSGLVELLKGKLSPTPSLPSLKMQVSVKNTYRGDCTSLMRFFPCSHPSPSKWDRLPYGSKTSPISTLTLSVCWPTQDESLIRDNQSFSDLNPLEANRWFVSCSAPGDNECYLSSSLETFSTLFKHTDSISSLLDKLVPGAYLQASEEQARFKNALKHVTGRTEPRPRSLKDTDTPLKLGMLQHMMNYLFNRSVSPPFPSKSCKYKTSPPGSLTERICICASAVVFSHGGLSGLLQLWHDVISELRRAWENGEELPDIDGEIPDFQFGLLHQKLQMLQCCIRHKTLASSPRQSLTSDVRFDKEEGTVHIGSPATSDSDEFFEASDGLSSRELDSEGDDVSVSMYQSCSSLEGTGRLKDSGMILMLTGDPMYIPVTQEQAPLTEDALLEQTNILSQLGCSQEASLLRASMQSMTLRSDMSAFKAANPGCVLEDFIRWYSPRDFIPVESMFSSMDLQSPMDSNSTPSTNFESVFSSLDTPTNEHPMICRDTTSYVQGKLSTRIRGSDSTWLQAWKDAESVPSSRQKRLFDDTKEAEKILQFFSTLSPSQLACLIFPNLLQVALNHFSSLPVACDRRCSEHLGELEAKLEEVEQLKNNYSDLSVKFCTDCLPLLARIDAHFCSVQAIYHYLMHGYHVFNDLEMRTHFQDVSAELLGLAARLQKTTSEGIQIEGAANSVQGQAVRGVFKSILSSHSPFKRKMGLDGGGIHSSQPSFGKPVFREYVLRTICPNPQGYSTTCHHRLYAGLSQDETRIATAISEDLRLF
ncbi:Rab3 GTPase-activating protein catalytic subunit isoform X2 [Oopsacas minuta]|uniref:Rab3 GTPase-activating protein catalytic subunit n=1 Tax=Oopsacas minuta TaxID=111878 RepID=A0AAV7JGL0_9METZ|nr:Rab3 GTPase-activating protein catalytic subunit isoform X2 [Oopsacas minuta]